MSETSHSSNPNPAKKIVPFLVKFLALAQELHGPLTQDFESSKSDALKAFQVWIDFDLTEDEATHSMKQDRAGTLSLSAALICKAALDDLGLKINELPNSRTCEIKLDAVAFSECGGFWFFQKAIDAMT